jgi:hypothetical protein
MGSLIINFMGGRYGKYGEIKRLARLRRRHTGFPFRVRGRGNPIELPHHGKGHPGRQGMKGSGLSVVEADKDRGAS